MKKFIHIKSVKSKTSGFSYCFCIGKDSRALGEMLGSKGVISELLIVSKHWAIENPFSGRRNQKRFWLSHTGDADLTIRRPFFFLHKGFNITFCHLVVFCGLGTSTNSMAINFMTLRGKPWNLVLKALMAFCQGPTVGLLELNVHP